MESQLTLKTLDRITGLPTIPVILFEVNKMLQDDECSVKKLSDLIESDQALTARILRLVNSAFYGFRSEIVDISRALIVLGFNTVRNAIVTVSTIDAFRPSGDFEGFEIKDLWKHSVAVAITSKQLAEKGRVISSDDAFVAGLLHDIGKIIIAQFFRDHFYKILQSMQEEKISFIEAEMKLSSVHHGHIGGYLAEKWQFPRRLADAIRFHHNMGNGKNAADPWLLVCVCLANDIVNSPDYSSSINPEFYSRFPEISKVFVPHLKNLSDWFPDVEIEIEEACRFFIEGDEQ